MIGESAMEREARSLDQYLQELTDRLADMPLTHRGRDALEARIRVIERELM